MVAVGTKGRPWLAIEPDKKYGLGYVDSGFTVPWDFPRDRLMLEAAARDTVVKTIEQCERIAHWKFLDRIPIRYELSKMPGRAEIDRFNSMTASSLLSHRDNMDKGAAIAVATDKPEIGFIARIWFVKPLDVVNLDEEAEMATEMDGFVSPDNMPKEYKNE